MPIKMMIPNRRTSGFVLIIAIASIASLFMLATSLVFNARQNLNQAQNFQLESQVIQIAEAGLEKVLLELAAGNTDGEIGEKFGDLQSGGQWKGSASTVLVSQLPDFFFQYAPEKALVAVNVEATIWRGERYRRNATLTGVADVETTPPKLVFYIID